MGPRRAEIPCKTDPKELARVCILLATLGVNPRPCSHCREEPRHLKQNPPPRELSRPGPTPRTHTSGDKATSERRTPCFFLGLGEGTQDSFSVSYAPTFTRDTDVAARSAATEKPRRRLLHSCVLPLTFLLERRDRGTGQAVHAVPRGPSGHLLHGRSLCTARTRITQRHLPQTDGSKRRAPLDENAHGQQNAAAGRSPLHPAVVTSKPDVPDIRAHGARCHGTRLPERKADVQHTHVPHTRAHTNM